VLYGVIDGDAHLACLTLAQTVEGRSVETLDGLKDGPNLHPLQRAFMDHFARSAAIAPWDADGGKGPARPHPRLPRRGRQRHRCNICR